MILKAQSALYTAIASPIRKKNEVDCHLLHYIFWAGERGAAGSGKLNSDPKFQPQQHLIWPDTDIGTKILVPPL